MKVYIVTEYGWEGKGLKAVYFDKKKAARYARSLERKAEKRNIDSWIEIKEFEVR